MVLKFEGRDCGKLQRFLLLGAVEQEIRFVEIGDVEVSQQYRSPLANGHGSPGKDGERPFGTGVAGASRNSERRSALR